MYSLLDSYVHVLVNLRLNKAMFSDVNCLVYLRMLLHHVLPTSNYTRTTGVL